MRYYSSIVSRLTSLLETARAEIGIVAGFLLSTALVLAFGLLAELVKSGNSAQFDKAVILALRAPGNAALPIGPAWLHELGRDVTALGSFVVLSIISTTVIGYLLLVQKQASALLMSVAVLGGTVLSNVMKLVFERPRPDIPTAVRVFTSGFPSSHATLSAIVFLTIGVLLTRTSPVRRIKVYFVTVAVVLTILVGVSRIYLGVHYPTDVMAGWCIGSAYALSCWMVAVLLQRRGAVEPPQQ